MRSTPSDRAKRREGTGPKRYLYFLSFTCHGRATSGTFHLDAGHGLPMRHCFATAGTYTVSTCAQTKAARTASSAAAHAPTARSATGARPGAHWSCSVSSWHNQPPFSSIACLALPFHQRRTPNHPATECHHQDQIAGVDASRTVSLIQRQRHGCRRSVAIALYIDNHFFGADLESFC